MKLLMISTALVLSLAAPAIADTKTTLGCEVKRAANGDYWNKVDADCVFRVGGLTLNDNADEPTPDEPEDEDEEDDEEGDEGADEDAGDDAAE